MFSLAAHTTDDRGRRVPVFTARGQPPARFEADPALREIVERLARTEQLGLHERLTRQHLIVASPLILLPLAIALLSTFLPGLPPAVSGAAVAVILLLSTPLVAKAGNAQLAVRTRATLLGEGRCPSCAYLLGGAIPEPDGRITCPECASAWDTASLGKPRPSAPVNRPEAAAFRSYTSRASAIDDLDRAIPLRDPLLRDLVPARAAELGAARIEQVRAAVRQATSRRRITTILAWLFLIALVPGAQFLLAFSGPGPARPFPAAVGCLFLLVFLLQIYRVFSFRSRSTALPAARALIEHGLCPSCAGDLALDPATSRIDCPACGAVWSSRGR